ncbi:MAG TPA: glycine oxidase ThiO [Vicinamibacterales bacterium]|nr:glycine oxidase ThiO [Vicinamibacterales bacterium]
MPSVIVVGGGVVGATIARELALAGARVRLLDARAPGDGATRASAGMLAPYIEGHPSSPLRELGRESLDLYDDFIVRLRRDSRSDIVYERCGTLEVALTQEGAEKLSAASGTLWREGVEARWVPAAIIPDLEPNVTPEAQGGLFIPQHGFVGVASLTAAAVAAAEARGAEVMVEMGVLGIRRLPDGDVEVRTATDSWEADACVMAAGSWSSRITVEGADPVPVTPIRGQLLQLSAPRGLLTRVIWGPAGYLVPWPDGSVLAGATVEDVGFDEGTTPEGRHALMEMAVALVPALKNASISDVRAGLRPRAPDDLPIIGRSKVVPGLVYATGHYRSGVLLAPLTAELVRRLVLDRSASTLPVLDPQRCGNL